MSKLITAFITLQNLHLGTTLAREEIFIPTNYAKDSIFQAKLKNYQERAQSHNFKMGTSGIDDSVAVVFEEISPLDAAFIYRLNDEI